MPSPSPPPASPSSRENLLDPNTFHNRRQADEFWRELDHEIEPGRVRPARAKVLPFRSRSARQAFEQS